MMKYLLTISKVFSQQNPLLAVICMTIAAMMNSCGEDDPKLFTLMSPGQTNINFKNTLVEDESANVMNYLYFYNGGGVATGDINNDGLIDLFFTGNMVRNRLYLNKGDFEFEDVTETSGVAEMQGWCTGATMVDINNDGLLDIYICRSADVIPERRRNLLYINEGNLQFTEKAAEYGLADEGYSTQATFFDYDKDNDLDLFLINHSLQEYAYGTYENVALRSQRNDAFGSKLYRNDQNRFINVSREAGIISNVLSFGLGIGISDLNNDSWPDLYVSNDFNEPDYLFINNRDGSFTESSKECLDQISLFSMGNDIADFNNDGLTDLITLDMLPEDNHLQKMHSGAENFDKFQMLFRNGFFYQYSRNMLHRNNGDGSFSEIGQLAGVSNTDWSWSALFCDFDNDGKKDLFVTNGYAKDYTDMDFMKYQVDRIAKERSGEPKQTSMELLQQMPSLEMPNYIFHNQGDSFTKKMNEWGLEQETVSSGAVYADLDNDGDMDLVTSNINEEAGIYRNNLDKIDQVNHFIKVLFEGPATNKAGIGAAVKIYCKGELFYQENFPVRGFQSSVDPRLNFGIGTHSVIDSLIVLWPDGKKQKLVSVQPNRTLMALYRDGIRSAPSDTVGVNTQLLADSNLIDFGHRENAFNDFTVQSLLPHYLSRSGPCMAKGDVNGDGREDFFIGGAKGQPSQIFFQNAAGRFIRTSQSSLQADSMSEDVAAEFFDADNDKDLDLYIGTGGYEWNVDDSALHDRLFINDGKGNFIKKQGALPDMPVSTGCVKAADIDADGDIDLFVGGRVVPGQYPTAPRSYILINEGKAIFKDASHQIAPALSNAGMLTDAVWMDLNNDATQDLITVGEWMPVSVFINANGKLVDKSGEYIKFPSLGWWNKILAEDFDNDGDLDLVIGNLGRNSQLKASAMEPVTLTYKDFDRNGSIDPLLSYYIGGVSYPAASRDDLTDQLPVLRKKFLTYSSYADATIKDLLQEDQLKDATVLKAEILETVYLENRGNEGFVKHSLPLEAQYFPVYAMSAADINADGKTDMLLAGNNSWVRIKFGRYNAGHAILLRGDGKGSFSYIPQSQSGLKIKHDIRSLQLIRNANKNVFFFGANNAPMIAYISSATIRKSQPTVLLKD